MVNTEYLVDDYYTWSWQSAIVQVDLTVCNRSPMFCPSHQCWIHWVQHRISRLPLPQLNSTVRRSTRSVDSTLGPSVNSTRLGCQTIDSIDRLDQFRGLMITGLLLCVFVVLLLLSWVDAVVQTFQCVDTDDVQCHGCHWRSVPWSRWRPPVHRLTVSHSRLSDPSLMSTGTLPCLSVSSVYCQSVTSWCQWISLSFDLVQC